ncbi:MAG: YggS family pyridoxal phosphate-dependent enzyme [Bacteroidales bacterium]|nr:YggS family pyridoxal phosphate-dependent enzyme [Bacteroidales bacterium]
MSIKNNLLEITGELPSTVKLVAVSKFISNEAIMEAYNAGQRDFAESRPQELARKTTELPADIRWHFIGHLQTNKIKLIIDRVTLFHSVDSMRLLNELNTLAQKSGITVKILLQEHISGEETKQGFSRSELIQAAELSKTLSYIRVCGLMGMASLSNDQEVIVREFRSLKDSFLILKETIFKGESDFSEISMGMSSDYHIAIREGSTIVRVGSKIFGERY